MNIHFKDYSLFEKLQKSTLAQIEVGSSLYGLEDEYSDKDVLCVYFPFRNQVFSFLQTHHQLQFKDSSANIDYLFVDVFTFVRNALSGDSTLNFEALHVEMLTETPLDFLYHCRNYFFNYQIIKAYLGFANRDVRQYWQQENEREELKKYLHAERGYLFARQLFQNEFYLKDPVLLQKKAEFKIMSLLERKAILNALLKDIEDFRKNVINKAIEKKILPHYMAPVHQKEIDGNLFQLRHSAQYQYAGTEEINLDLFYSVNENGIVYE